MSIIRFDKKELGNLEYSLQREVLSTNRAGGYMSTTIVCCNTRKYHGLMICPVEAFDNENLVLLSSLDETVIQHGKSFNLAIHRFPGIYEPRGHKYIIDFNFNPTTTITYMVGGVVLKKEMLWLHSSEQLLIRYTLLEAKSDTTIRLRPFLAFRGVHGLSKANVYADGHSYPVKNGVKNRLYEKYPWLYLQMNTDNEFIVGPDWYYNFEYLEEKNRGYPFQEDLYTTGFFELPIKKGERVIFSSSTSEADTEELETLFENELAKRSEKTEFLPCLRHSARQFIVRRGKKAEVVAGYPWFGRWGRDTFISLPGITLTQGDVQSCKDVVDTLTGEMKDGLFPNVGSAYNSVDAPLWFFWTLQELEKHIGKEEIWKNYSVKMKEVLASFMRGINDNAMRVCENGLVWASKPGYAFTWMDAVVDGIPVTGRDGFQVEINALWYNAICYTLDLAKKYDDVNFVNEWGDMPNKIKDSFLALFWNDNNGYLADHVYDGYQNNFIRSNQVIACSLPHTMLSEEQIQKVLLVVKKYLLTPKGLRTLSPNNPLYKGRCEGDQPTRDRAYHQGTVWVWQLEHFVKANFDLYGKGYLAEAKDILSHFEEDITDYGIGSIAEIYDGDPPHHPRGAISQAWSVGAVLRINEMIQNYEKTKKRK
ncbi:MAG: amylo-alpha-1,6-glucosidase [Rikenellaceae bacterium]|nr:amylo-alpha-1,6-glucosidase [Rikenellaceae bacterium]